MHSIPPETATLALTDTAQVLCRQWLDLCARHLPVSPPAGLWRYSRAPRPDDLRQGWKLHVSATVLTASTVLQEATPCLQQRGVMYKAPQSLQELSRLNTGLYYGYPQIGKFLTVYPRSDEEALLLAEELHSITAKLSAPPVPFDLRFRPDSCVYYRYGAFETLALPQTDGTRTLALRDPVGALVPDLRDTLSPPAWVSNPFPTRQPAPPLQSDSPLQHTFRAFRAVTQRGKGGVYEAFDLSTQPPRRCIIKEGRRGGEMGWDGRDGAWRVRHEERVVYALRAAGIAAPQIYGSFAAEQNYYLVTEQITGETLYAWLRRRHRRLPLVRGLEYGQRLAELLARIHAAGWAWRDCKPTNLIVTPEGELRPLDFEGACPLDSPDPAPWGTPGFTLPAAQTGDATQSPAAEDLYALGVTIYLLLTGRLPAVENLLPVACLRRGVPAELHALVAALLVADAAARPSAQTVARQLQECQSRLRK